MRTKEIIFDRKANTGLKLYLQEELFESQPIEQRPFILVIPGGGYSFCSEREGEPIALSFLSKGYHAGVLHYHVGEHRHFQKALSDGQKAMELLQECAEEWQIDRHKIAVIGFSAGGHLAAAMSTMLATKPALCLLGYPAILASFSEVMGISAPSLEECVTSDTPPTFLFSTFEDSIVPIENSLLYLRALEENDVPFESHIFQKGPHGLSLATKWYRTSDEVTDERFARWFPFAMEWMESQWEEQEKGNELSTREIIDIPIFQLVKESENQQVLQRFFPSWQDPSRFKLVKRLNLKQLRRMIPDQMTNERFEQLIDGLNRPKEEH